MIPVPSYLHYHGFIYTQICRGIRSCVYQQTLHDKPVAFEVFLILIEPEIEIKWKFYPACERWPKGEDFEKNARTYFTKEQVIKKFKHLERILPDNT